ncbi:MAG: quinone-dependent dihydroorotate dehydrogenase [Chitinophagaceae bacterium]
MYPYLRSLLFRFSPEKAHHLSMDALKMAVRTPIVNDIVKKQFKGQFPRLGKEVMGLMFANPVGLAAGFDKNALYLDALDALGFGYMEIGTVTPKAQPGNPQPRLFRLPQDKALINRMGFNNEGVDAVRDRLVKWRGKRVSKMIVGGNIGKNKVTSNEEAWRDYEICFNALFDCVDYFVVNVSSPNTPGLRELQEKGALSKILGDLQNINQGKSQPKPLLLKIAPDLTNRQLDDIAEIAHTCQLSGIVATNTTISRAGLVTLNAEIEAIGAGGLSGKPVREASTVVVRYLRKILDAQTVIMASGGIFTGENAAEKIKAGAQLVQIWTGFIYEGPAIVRKICTYLEENRI